MHVDRLPLHSDPSGPEMTTPAPAPAVAGTALAVGTITASDGGRLTVAAGGISLEARRAVSCLIEPAVGDTVLLLADGRVGQRVLAVLDRDAATALTLTAGDGRGLTIAAPDITLSADRRLSATAPETALVGQSLSVRVERASLVGRVVEATADTLKTVALTLMSVAERWTASAGTSTRLVHGTDTVQARDLVYQASETAVVRGTRASVSAVDDVVVTGARISMT